MARPITDEELQLKKRARRRLVGAIVLVAAIAVVLPMLLDSEPKPSGQKVEIQIPSPDSGDFKPHVSPPASPAVAPPATEPTSKAASPTPKADMPAAVAEATPPAPAMPAPTTAATPAGRTSEPSKDTKPAAASTMPEKPPAASASGAYVVQVAALADSAKAKALEKRMAGTGLKTYTEVITTQSGEVTRVRAGPYATRDAAEKARAQLKKAGLDGKVVPR